MPCGFDLDTTISHIYEEKVLDYLQNTSAVRMDNLFAVDGSGYFNRPGPRIVDGLEILLDIFSQKTFSTYPQHNNSWIKI